MRINRVRQLISLVVLMLLIIIMTCGWVILPAYADNVTYNKYTTALEDLTRDENFNTAKYVDDAGKYSLQVIQIAESADGELFVYTYQPCQKSRYLVATSLNMSLSENVDSTQIYDLSLLNVSGVLCKYLVHGVTVQSADETRYYNITGIYRAWDKDIDDDTGNDNEINEVVYSVGQLWTVTNHSDGFRYDVDCVEFITVIDKYVGYLRYKDGASGILVVIKEFTDSHYVAFSTDKRINKLFEVDITFVRQSVMVKTSPTLPSEKFYIGEKIIERKTLFYDEKEVETTPEGWVKGNVYKWNRIETVKDFKNNPENKFEDFALTQLENKQWVLRFYESDYTYSDGKYFDEIRSVEVSDVTILRLKFDMNGEIYNLGVVDNKQTGGNRPSNTQEKSFWELFMDFCKWLESITGVSYIIWAIVFIAIPCGVIYGVLSIFFPILRDILGWVWFVITSPFRGIAALVHKIKGD